MNKKTNSSSLGKSESPDLPEIRRVSFSAIDKYVESHIIEPTEKLVSGREFINWGDKNNYPNYIMDLYRNVPTLQSIIHGLVDYVTGNAVVSNSPAIDAIFTNKQLRELVRQMAWSYALFSGYPLEVIRTKDLTGISDVKCDNMCNVRSDKENDAFYYSERFGEKGYNRHNKVFVVPKFMKDGEHERSIMFVKNEPFQTYPSPMFSAAVKACEIERCIDEFHLNAINNGFTASYIVNFNNGVPQTEDEMNEVQRDFNEKFAGHQNAGRIALCWNDSRVNATTLEKIDVQDYGEKYNTLEKRSRQEIFTAFRANPNLFGIPTESLGFSAEEYESAFKLFNKTIVKPIQDTIIDSLDEIFGMEGCISIVPFSMEDKMEE